MTIPPPVTPASPTDQCTSHRRRRAAGRHAGLAALTGRRLVLLTVLLGGFTAFGPLSMDLYLPAFPQLADDLGASQSAVQLTLTADVIGIVVGQLVLGPMSDAWGRRRLLLGSTLVCALASVLCALAPSAGLLVVWRFFQGASGGGGDRAGQGDRRGYLQRGGGGAVVLAVHDPVQRRADRRARCSAVSCSP